MDKNINTHISLNLKNYKKEEYPFPYAIIQNPFGVEDDLERDFPSMDNAKSSIRMDKDITYPSKSYLNLIAASSIYSNLHNSIYSVDFISKIIDLFKEEIQDNINNKKLLVNPYSCNYISSPLEIQIQSFNERLYETSEKSFFYPRVDLGIGGPGYGLHNGGGGIHTDNETRLISILYYVNTPENIKGGDHRIYSVVDKKPVLHKSISPQKGIMIASLQTNYALHDVDPILTIDGYRKAFYIAISCNHTLWAREEDWLMKLTKNRAGNQNLITKIEKNFSKIFK